MSSANMISRRMPKSMHKTADYLYRSLRAVKWRAMVLIYRRRHCGPGSFIDPSVHVLGWRAVRIGRNVVIAGGSILNVNNRDASPKIVIGDNSYIGRYSFFSSGISIEIAPYALLSPGCRLLGAHHVYDDPFRPYISTGVTKNGVLRLGTNVMMGANATIMGSVAIGHGSVIGANALVTHNVPPFSLVVGSPARIVKRFNILTRRWVAIADFTPEMERILPCEESYLVGLRTIMPSIAMPYAAAGPAQGDLP